MLGSVYKPCCPGAHLTLGDVLLSQVEQLRRELVGQSAAFEQSGLDLEVLTEELEMERRKNHDLPQEIRATEAHKVEAIEAKVRITKWYAFCFG